MVKKDIWLRDLKQTKCPLCPSKCLSKDTIMPPPPPPISEYDPKSEWRILLLSQSYTQAETVFQTPAHVIGTHLLFYGENRSKKCNTM